MSWSTHRGQLIQQEKLLDSCNYLSAVLNNKWTFKYVIMYNLHLIGSGRQCWGQLIHAGVSWSMAQLTIFMDQLTPCLKDYLTPGQPYCLSDYLSLTERRFRQIICSKYTFIKHYINHHPNQDHHIYNCIPYSHAHTRYLIRRFSLSVSNRLFCWIIFLHVL